jgi:hypothetical protein
MALQAGTTTYRVRSALDEILSLAVDRHSLPLLNETRGNDGGIENSNSALDHSLELSLNFSQPLSDPDRVGEDGFLVIVLISGGDWVELVCDSKEESIKGSTTSANSEDEESARER